ncbi:MAG: AMP-binding protein [Gammaproteobacteria bacterium]
MAATGARCLSIGEVRGCTSFLDFVAQRPVTPPSGRIGGALLTYTSGTTGPPKGVLRQLRDVPPGEVLAPLTRWFRDTFRLEEHHGGVHLNTCPLHFSGPLLFTAYALNLGHTVVLMPAWHPRLALQLIERRRVTTAFMVPFQFLSLLKLPPDVRERYSRTSVKCVIHGSAPCPMEVKRQMLNWWGDIIFECYGATEVGGTVASPEEWRRYPGTVGKPYGHTEIRIYDEAGTQLPPLAPGRIFMRRAAVNEFVYKGDPAKTLAARLGEFVTVSDIGYLNEEGFLFLLDRRVDMITCRGEHIYPAQLESTLLMHPAVADCAFFGMPHPEWGSAVRAAVQLESGIAPSDTLAAQLLEFLETSTAASQCPSRIDFVESMPRDASGKLRRAEVRARFEAEGS